MRDRAPYIINSYKRKSRSARVLAKALGGHVYGGTPPGNRSSFEGSVVINWGDGQCPLVPCLNHPEKVRLASNKLHAFRAMKQANVSIPDFATSMGSVSWKGTTVVRHKLQGHSGDGIEIVEDRKYLPEGAPLYVQYIKKEAEFRIHVGRKGGSASIIAVQRKARDLSVPDSGVNWQVRNHVNGFIFAREGANPNDDCLQQACNALRALGLDFGAVDIIWNHKEGKAYVLEINTAPGLEGQTIDDYASFFRSHS